MNKIKEIWAKSEWPVKAIVVTAGILVAIKLVLWLEQVGVITNVVK